MLKKLSEAQLERLLEAGVEAFSLHGPAGASMRSIADRAGVSVGVLYKYYGDKEGFLRACLDRSLAALDEVLASVTAEEAGFRAHTPAGSSGPCSNSPGSAGGMCGCTVPWLPLAERRPRGWRRRSRGLPPGSTGVPSPPGRRRGICAGTWTPACWPSSLTAC